MLITLVGMASENTNDDYNITVNQRSCTSNLWIKGEDLTNSTYGTSIAIGNLTWDNTTNNSTMTTSYAVVNTNIQQFENATTYYWLNVPAVKAGGPYKENITIMTNRTPGPE